MRTLVRQLVKATSEREVDASLALYMPDAVADADGYASDGAEVACTANYTDVDETRAAAERLAEERA
jgi:hypothetical protein